MGSVPDAKKRGKWLIFMQQDNDFVKVSLDDFYQRRILTGSWSWPEHHFQASDLQGTVFLY